MSRPTKFNDETKEKIKEGFGKGLNKSEVCIYAGISRPTLDKFLDPEKHKKFAAECEVLKSNLSMHAKLNIATEIIDNKDLSTSKYYLEKAVDANEKDNSVNGVVFIDNIPTSDREKYFGGEDNG